jgi:hypothetical protein
VFAAKPGITLARPKPASGGPMRMATPRMGLGAGGRIAQKIYPDPHGLEVWDTDHPTALVLHIVNSLVYRDLTGREPPPTPIDARTYSERGYPWFRLYEEGYGDVTAPDALTTVKTIAERDRERGERPDDRGFDVAATQIENLTPGSARPTPDARGGQGGPRCQVD